MNPVKIVDELSKSAYKAVEYLNELTQRDTPLKPINSPYWECPVCRYDVDEEYNFCLKCGQRLEWTK